MEIRRYRGSANGHKRTFAKKAPLHMGGASGYRADYFDSIVIVNSNSLKSNRTGRAEEHIAGLIRKHGQERAVR